MSDCKICLVDHQSEIHNATLNVRRWLRDDIRRKLEGPAQPQPPAKKPERPEEEDLPKSA